MDLSPQLSAFLQIMFDAAAPALAVALISWAAKSIAAAYAEFKSANPESAYVLETAALMAVKAAEQSGLSWQLIGGGKAKKDYALRVLSSYLKSRGIHLSFDVLSAAIEAAVLDHFPHSRARETG